ncbi:MULTISPECIES: hypothetical protein [Pseudomonas]|uniref:hypothetical protein n=1 Tax=Pseudomonas TaxID=286 RepID=UPI000406E126|nr:MULTISPECIES: hypothetical protein [Pseudomonas]MCW2271900.1 hypothetical protein [Pseudomonas sp. JUb96]
MSIFFINRRNEVASWNPTRPAIVSTENLLLASSPGGAWAANGRVWQLADFTLAAGYRHLQ